MLALLAAQTILVLPFATQGSAPKEAGVALAEAVLDVVVQANQDNFLTLKQLDAVLRRRDLKLDDATLADSAKELAMALGATEIVTGEVSLSGDKLELSARLKSLDGALLQAAEAQGSKAALPGLAQKLGLDLLQADAAMGPMTGSAQALFDAAACEARLARQSLGVRSQATLSGEKLALADKLCRSALKADPKLGLARAGAAVVLALQNKLGEARQTAHAAQGARFVPLAALAEAYAARKLNDRDGWKQVLASAVEARPGFLHALGYLAEDAMEHGEDKEALALFQQYLARAPQHTWAMGKVARELAKTGETDAAIELSEKALALNPDDPELLIETASRYIDAGRDPRAEPLLKAAMNSTPPRPLAALRLGYLYIRTHKLPQAREALEACIRMATREDEARTRGIAHADLARVAAKQNRYPDAISELQKARSEGNDHLPCDEPELNRWKDRPELKALCVEAAAAAAANEHGDEDVVPTDL